MPTTVDLDCQDALLRVHLKIRMLDARFGHEAYDQSKNGISASHCPEYDQIERRLSSIEAKLDALIDAVLRSDEQPKWQKASEDRLSRAIQMVSTEFAVIRSNGARLKEGIQDLAEGADRFLASVRQKLPQSQCNLFFELIATTEGDGTRRGKSYTEIGRRLGITKQAVQQQYRRMVAQFPTIRDFVEAIRHPGKERNFSEMSPSERRKLGVDSTYDHRVE
jgi:hypothetical protein